MAILLAHFFLSPLQGRGASSCIPQIVLLIEQHDAHIACMILAETIGGLTKSAYQRIPFISLAGSPLLLFLWILDKLMLIPPPP